MFLDVILTPVIGTERQDSVHGQFDELRRMPESLAAEVAVLGSMIIDPVCIGDVMKRLTPDSFCRVEHQIIYATLVALYQNHHSEDINGSVVRDELRHRGQIEAIQCTNYLCDKTRPVPSSANVLYYADIVSDKAILRQLIQTASETMDKASDQTNGVSELLDEARQRLDGVRQRLDEAKQRILAATENNVSTAAISVKELVSQFYEGIEKRERTHVTGASTEYFEFNDMTCGPQQRRMDIAEDWSSMEKTAFPLNVTEHLGLYEKIPLAMFAPGIDSQMPAAQFLYADRSVDTQPMHKGVLSTEYCQKRVGAYSTLSEGPIYIADTSFLRPTLIHPAHAVTFHLDETIQKGSPEARLRDEEDCRFVRSSGQVVLKHLDKRILYDETIKLSNEAASDLGADRLVACKALHYAGEYTTAHGKDVHPYYITTEKWGRCGISTDTHYSNASFLRIRHRIVRRVKCWKVLSNFFGRSVDFISRIRKKHNRLHRKKHWAFYERIARIVHTTTLVAENIRLFISSPIPSIEFYSFPLLQGSDLGSKLDTGNCVLGKK